MATPAERKALLFFALVATLGAAVRLWRAHRPPDSSVIMSADGDVATADGDDATYPTRSSRRADGEGKPRKGSAAHGAGSSGKRPRAVGKARSRTGHIDRDFSSTVDLDRASVSAIDALGVLQPGMARLIVADRDSFGPFGSIQELARVPFLTTTVIRKLAPRVTFSRLPRPSNTVIQPRSRTGESLPKRVRRRKGSAQ